MLPAAGTVLSCGAAEEAEQTPEKPSNGVKAYEPDPTR